jgi:hypothetical protein
MCRYEAEPKRRQSGSNSCLDTRDRSNACESESKGKRSWSESRVSRASWRLLWVSGLVDVFAEIKCPVPN